jgi:hypothetical protein
VGKLHRKGWLEPTAVAEEPEAWEAAQSAAQAERARVLQAKAKKYAQEIQQRRGAGQVSPI